MKLNLRWPFILSALLFILALIFPTYEVENKSSDYMQGFGLLLVGWLSIFSGSLIICWLANPMLLMAWVLPNFKIKRIFALAAVLCALYFLNFETMIINEAGHKGQITSYGLGYYFWVASMLIYFIGITIISLKYYQNTSDGAAR